MNGALALQPETGQYTFSPDYRWFGETSFTFKYATAGGSSELATARLRINPIAPVAKVLTVQGRAPSINGIVTATDPNGLPVQYSLWQPPTLGSVTLNSQTGQFSFVPQAGFSGDATFTFVATNTHKTSEPALVTVRVLASAPTVSPLSFSSTIGNVVAGRLTAVDPQGLPLSYIATTSSQGVIALNSATGDFIFTPNNPNWRGITSFQYKARNSTGFMSSYATVSLTIGIDPGSAQPVAESFVVSLTPYQLYASSISLKGYDPGGRAITYSITSMPEIVSYYYLNPSNGGLNVNFAYKFPEGIEAINYTVNNGLADSNIGTASLVYEQPVWAQPIQVASTRVDESIPEDTAYRANVVASGGDGHFEFALSQNSGNGVVLINPSTGAFVATPNPDFTGSWWFAVSVKDTYDHYANVQYWLTVSPVNDAPIASDVEYSSVENEPLTGYLPGYDVDGDLVTYTLGSQPTVGSLTLDEETGVFSYQPIPGWYGQVSFTYSVTDGELASSEQAVTLHVLPGGIEYAIPPDPSTIAPRANCCVPTDFYSSNSFLFTHVPPVQYEINIAAVDAARMTVVRGMVLGPQGVPLAGAKVRALSQQELGFTISRHDGAFDLVLNGGGVVTLRFERPGYLPVDRKVDAPWLDFATLEDVVLTPLDAAMTEVQLESPNTFVHVATQRSDASGSRRAVLLFPPNVKAAVRLTDGSQHLLKGPVHVRATEYTVGDHGPEAMPALLPPASAYTYALEYSLDEAMYDNVTAIDFSKPIVSYNENFLNLPVGMVIPVGFYERRQYDSGWEAEKNGRIMAVLDIVADKAVLDVDGDGYEDPALYGQFGISDFERQTIATLYETGTSFWRVELNHFTPYDYNFFSFIPGKIFLRGPDNKKNDPKTDDQCPGSILCIQSQSLAQEVSIQGTDLVLRYDSKRTPGNAKSLRLTFSLVPGDSSAEIPLERYVSAEKVHLVTSIAGRREHREFTPEPELTYEFVWDGKDAYGRPIIGTAVLEWKIGWEYSLQYASIDPSLDVQLKAFAMFPGIEVVDSERLGNSGRINFIVWQEGKSEFETWQNSVAQFAGWSLTAQHAYDRQHNSMFQGDGKTRRATAQGASVFTFAGNGSPVYSGDTTSARQSGMQPTDLVAMADGSVVFGDASGNLIRRIDAQGFVSTLAGNGTPAEANANVKVDGIGTEQSLDLPIRLTRGADGTVYVLERSGRLSRLLPNGTFTSILGKVPNSVGAYDEPRYGGMAVDRDGFVIVAATTWGRLLKISQYGEVQTIAGTGEFIFNQPEETYAEDAALGAPEGVAVSPDNEIYFSDSLGGRLYKVSADGRLYRVAGGGVHCSEFGIGIINGDDEFAGDTDLGFHGDTVCSSKFASMKLEWSRDGLVFAKSEAFGALLDGSVSTFWIDTFRDLYFHGNFENAQVPIQRITSQGTFVSLVEMTGNGVEFSEGVSALRNDGAEAFSVAPDGTIYFVVENQIRRAVPPFPGVRAPVIAVSAPSGGSISVFDKSGRHLESIDPLTGEKQRAFRYDENGLVMGVIDGDGNETLLERDSAGNLQAFVSPYGQRTKVHLDVNGYLAALVDQAGNRRDYSYTPDGLMLSYADPNRGVHSFEYDSKGKLIRDTSPSGAFQTLSRVDLNTTFKDKMQKGTAYQISLSNGLGHSTVFTQSKAVEPRYEVRREKVDPTGVREIRESGGVGSYVVHPDGTSIRTTENPDPRFGLQSATIDAEIRTPGNILATTTHRRQFYPMNSGDRPARLIDRVTTELGEAVSEYDGYQRQRLTTSPEGRTAWIQYNTQGRPSVMRNGDFTPIELTYDSRGRLTQTKRGERVSTLIYGPNGKPSTVIDALGRSTELDYDQADRLLRSRLPGGRVVEYRYDANGNLVGVQPPSRPFHEFTFTSFDEVQGYYPPSVFGAASGTTYEYHPSTNQLVAVHLADGRSLTYERDAAGRVIGLNHDRGRTSFIYNYSTGNLSSIRDPGGHDINFYYDGGLVTEVNTGTGTMRFAYQTGMLLKSEQPLTSLNGAVIPYTYDKDGLVTKIGLLNIDRAKHSGLPTAYHLDNVHSYYAYNEFGEPVGYSATHSNGFSFTASYVRDEAGRIVSKTEAVRGQSTTYDYGFDDAGHLTKVDRNGQPWSSYTYDPNGNRLSHTSVSGSESGVYDEQDRLVSYGDYTYSYSPVGALAARTQTSTGTTTLFNFDSQGNLMQVQLPIGKTIDYVVDGLNRRVGKRVNGVLIQGFLYRGGLQVAAEVDRYNKLVSQFIYSSQANVPDYMIRGGVRYQLIRDQIGSVRFVVNSGTGTVVQELAYDEFGNVVVDTNPGFQPFGFAGGLYDPDTGLTRFGARDYDPFTGRWTSKDPFGFRGGDTNLYGYVINDPINLVDPSGNIPLVLALPIAGGLVNGVYSAVSAGVNGQSMLSAFGAGFVGGAVGTSAALLAGLGTGNPFLAGAAGGEAGYIAQTLVSGGSLNAVDAAIATVGGGITAGLAVELLPTRGRLPDLLRDRNILEGKNTQRLLGQEAIANSLAGTVQLLSDFWGLEAAGGCQ